MTHDYNQSAPGVARDVLSLAWPAVLTSFLQTAVFLVDRLVLGRFSRDALASMQVQGPLVWSLSSVFGGLVIGAIPIVARAIGAGDRDRARATTETALRFAFVLGAVVGVLTIVFVEPIVATLGPPSEPLRALSRRYVVTAMLGFPQMFVATTAALLLGAAGNTRTPFLVGLFTNAVNIVANVILVFGVELGALGRIPALGVTGSAAASVIAFTLEAGLMLWLVGHTSSPLVGVRAWRRGGAAESRAGRDILRLSTPAVAERLVFHASYLAYAGVITRLGELTMAANQALVTLESICFLSADGFGIAAAAVVGQSLGQKNSSRATRGGWLAAAMCALALSLLGLCIWALARPLLELFVPSGTDGSALVGAGRSAVPLLALSQPFMAIAVVLAQALRGAGDTKTPLLAAFVGGTLLRVSLAAWLGFSLGFGIVAVWVASAVDWIARAGLLAAVFSRGRWAKIEV